MGVLLVHTLSKSGLLPSAAGSPDTATAPHGVPATPVTPQTPTRQKNDALSSNSESELIPSPSHLTRYLKHAETQLGVRHALTYKTSLELNGIGPDILPDVDDKLLASLGISAGDVIRLKNGSMAWWNGPDAKRKRSNTVTSDAEGWSSHGEEQPKKKVAYEKRFHDKGGNRFTGPPMRPDDGGDDLDRDYDLVYFCESQKQWLPVPRGFTVDEDEEPSLFGAYL